MQRSYRSTIELFAEQHRDDAEASNWLKSIEIPMRQAAESGPRPDSPTIGLHKMRIGSSGYRTWTEADFEQ